MAMVNKWIIIATELFINNEFRCRNRHELYAGHYSKNMLEKSDQLRSTIKVLVELLEPSELDVA